MFRNRINVSSRAKLGLGISLEEYLVVGLVIELGLG
jgi:hypothetical protein